MGSAKPKGPHRIATLSDSEPTKRHETRGHSSWFVLCCPGLGYIASECRRWAPASTMGCLDGREVVVELRRRTLVTMCSEGASYRPRHTPSESECEALDSHFTQRMALSCRLAVLDVPHAARTRHMLRASERPNEDGACGQAARRKVAGNSLPDVYRAMHRL